MCVRNEFARSTSDRTPSNLIEKRLEILEAAEVRFELREFAHSAVGKRMRFWIPRAFRKIPGALPRIERFGKLPCSPIHGPEVD
jgi:hypothetical protein